MRIGYYIGSMSILHQLNVDTFSAFVCVCVTMLNLVFFGTYFYSDSFVPTHIGAEADLRFVYCAGK